MGLIMSMVNNTFQLTIPEYASMKQAEAQHAPGVHPRMNPRTFRVEYVRPDGSIVPEYDWFLKAALERRI